MNSRIKWVVGVAALVAVIGGAYFLWPLSDSKGQVAPAPAEPAKPQTIPEMLAAGAKSDIGTARSRDITFTGVRIDDGTPYDFPGGKVAYFRFGMQEHTLGLLEQADILGAKSMRRAFQADPNIVAVYIDFVGPVPDRYGHRFDAPWISFEMDRRTYDKIDWAGFDPSNFCEFLSHEHVFDADSKTFCGTKGEL